MELEDFVHLYRTCDVNDLLLHAPREAAGLDLHAATAQISGWQKARHKLPLWASTPHIRFGSQLNMEQCSSQRTAEYKGCIVSMLFGGQGRADGTVRIADLTGGMGVDSVMMARSLGTRVRLTFVEQDAWLCKLARHNFPLLIEGTWEVRHCNAEDALNTLPRQHLIYIDPARRDRHGSRTYALRDCTPYVTPLLPRLSEKADWLLVKLSPMLDVQEAIRELGGVAQAHVVSLEGECKELLLLKLLSPSPTTATQDLTQPHTSSPTITSRDAAYPLHSPSPHAAQTLNGAAEERSQTPTIHCVNLEHGTAHDFTFSYEEERYAQCLFAESIGKYLYLPNASILKAGAWRSVAARYGLRKLSPNSHLYTNDDFIGGFPGRTFHFIGEITQGKGKRKPMRPQGDTPTSELAALGGRANITVRNYPLSAEQLRRKLKLRDGGADTVIGTTLRNGRHVLLHCRPVQSAGACPPSGDAVGI